MILDDEEAKAAQELAKATGKGIDASRELGGFMNTVCGEGLAELGGAFKDWATVFRYTNMLQLRDKVGALHRKHNIEGKTIPIDSRQSIPLLEAASLESDESLQDMWANLISNATDPKQQLNLNRVHIEILSKFEPLDVIVMKELDGMETRELVGSGISKINTKVLVEDLFKKNIASKDEIVFSLQNLSRLGCIEPLPDLTIDGIGTGVSFSELKTVFSLTVLGSSLLIACKE